MDDGPSALARRHMEEGRLRLLAQMALVEELTRDGPAPAAKAARRLLVEMERTQLARLQWLAVEELYVREQGLLPES